MPVKTCAELEKLTVCGLLAARKSKRALVRQLLEKKLLRAKKRWFTGRRCRSSWWPAPNIRAFEVTARKRKSRALDVDGKMKVVCIKL